MSQDITGILDAIAAKAATITGIKGASSATGGGQGATVRLVPAGIDDTPWFLSLPGSGDLDAGNAETFVHYPEGMLWINAANPGYALSLMVPLIAAFQVAFRRDIQMNTTASGYCVMTGYDRYIHQTEGGKPYLVLPLNFRAVEKNETTYTNVP